MLKTTRSVAAMARSMPGRSLRHLGGWWGNRGMERAGNLFKNSRKCVFPFQSFPIFLFFVAQNQGHKSKENCIWKRKHAGRCSGGIEAWRGPFPNPKYSTNKKTFSPQICVVVMSIKCTEQGIGTPYVARYMAQNGKMCFLCFMYFMCFLFINLNFSYMCVLCVLCVFFPSILTSFY